MGDQTDQWWVPRWVKDRPNILACDNQKKLHEAFGRGIVFGRHYFFHGGSSGDSFAFHTFEQFAEYLHRSRPGDLYEVWSLPDLVAKGLILAHSKRGQTNMQMPMPPEEEMQAVRTYPGVEFREYFAIFVEDDSNDLEIQLDDGFGYEDIITYLDGSDGWSFNEVWILPFTTIEAPEHIHLKAKYPNEQGELPIGGAY
jgi:hypothetical protein